jgi:hypothetical protein
LFQGQRFQQRLSGCWPLSLSAATPKNWRHTRPQTVAIGSLPQGGPAATDARGTAHHHRHPWITA